MNPSQPSTTAWDTSKLQRGGIVLLCVFCVSTAWALLAGPYPITGITAFKAIFGYGEPIDVQVMQHLRLPRMVAAWLIGAALAASGAAYQMLFRNPLISADVLGVSSGATLGALLAIFLGFSVLGIQFFAFMSALLTVVLVYQLSKLSQSESIISMVLIGLVTSAFIAALAAMLKVMADPNHQLPAMLFWTLGSLSHISWQHVLMLLPALCLGMIGLVWCNRGLNALAWGEEEAMTLGVSVKRTKLMVIVSATLLTAIVVAMAGIIGWVGLLVPHLARLWVGNAFHRNLPASVLIGALFMAFADAISQSFADAEIPLGVVTAIIGAPYFLYAMRRAQRTFKL